MSETNFRIKGDNFQLDSENLSKDGFNILSSTDTHWTVKFNHKIYQAEILSFDATTKNYSIKIDEQIVQFQLMDEVDVRIEEMGMNVVKEVALDKLLAPMPGLVIDIEVNIGDAVEIGDTLLVLEAMKMENVIKATGKGTVKEVSISKGATVDKGQLMIQF